jgi:NAD(P)-dependent dehydrogenase (short-subunit alcohol dehydrogenase family)
MRLKDLSIAITGSGRGIGRSIAICCADEGARVVINDIHSLNLQEVRNTLESKGVKVVAFRGDISKRSEAQGFIEAGINEFGRIDVLVNNAGIAKFIPFLDITEEDWDEVMRVNLKAVFHCAQCAVRYMVKQGGGRIINISSRAYLGTPKMAHYASSKAGVLGLTRSMAMELGPYGITVNAVAPGMIDTELLRSTSSDDFIRDRLEKIPLHKFGSPEDIAHAVVFLASPEATYITGEILHVTGGLY